MLKTAGREDYAATGADVYLLPAASCPIPLTPRESVLSDSIAVSSHSGILRSIIERRSDPISELPSVSRRSLANAGATEDPSSTRPSSS